MSNQQILICVNGDHQWKRPVTRGKKPRFCPKHAPVAAVKSSTVTLTCAHGHTWERPRTKGKTPKYCPDHKPEAAIKAPKTEVLQCEQGHEWTRVKCGRAPKFCPEHKPEKVVNVKSGTGIPRADLDNPLVSAILDGPDTELRRKMAYVVNEFRNPRESREIDDFKGLHYTFKRLLQESAKILKTAVPTL
jgi:hypothetical protein